jgi:adenylate cyclase
VNAADSAGHGATIAELAEDSGVAAVVLRRWQRLGLLSGPGDTADARDLDRVRLITFVEGRGISAEAIAEACKTQGDLLGSYLALVQPAGVQPGVGRSLEDAATATGLNIKVLWRLWTASGLSDQPEVYDGDVEAIRSLKVALDAGLPEPALAQILRVFADALGRVADAESRLFHYYVHERLRAEGLSGPELTETTQAIGEPLTGLIEPTVIYFHRKAWERALREDLLVHLTEDETTPLREVPGEVEATILFVDLSGFTPLTEVMGDPAAASLVERFSALVREAAVRHHGKVVKQIGDEFMLTFTDPQAAVSCGQQIESAASAEAQFPAVRQGAHTGRVLYREGDYVGATVNIAARVAAQAERHQFLVTAALKAAATGPGGIEWQRLGTRALRGIADPVELFDVSRIGARPEREVDPVCRMELDRTLAATRLGWRGRQLYFCSEDCLARFVAEPARYERFG